jgi:hypothetical protein
VTGQLTDISQWPNFNSQRKCIRDILGCSACDNVQARLACVSWSCSCNHFEQGLFFTSSLALAWCSATQDVAVATSIFSGFCGQFQGGNFVPVTMTGTGGSVIGGSSTTTGGQCMNRTRIVADSY